MGKRLNVLGFMKASGDELHTFCGEGSVKADFVIESINTWRSGLTKPTVLVLDNARIHRSASLAAQLTTWQQQGLFIFFLPTYSPHLNRIERLWLKAKQRWLNPIDYESLASLRCALERIWSQFGQTYQINFN